MAIIEQEQSTRQDFDGAWKLILDKYFKDFLHVFLSDLYGKIDWNYQPISLDKELQKIIRTSETSKRTVDKLFKVRLMTDIELWVLIHIEFQAQKDDSLPERLFVGHYRAYDLYKKPILTLAILGDNNINWRPQCYQHQIESCKLRFDFLTIKLLDYEISVQEGKRYNSLMLLVQAHIKAIKTAQNSERRLNYKLNIIKTLMQNRLAKTEVIELINFVDWLMELSEPLMLEYNNQLKSWNESLQGEKNMANVSPTNAILEKIYGEKAMAKGLEQGIEQGIEQGMQRGIRQGLKQGQLTVLRHLLQLQFGELPAELEQKLNNANSQQLLEWSTGVLKAKKLQELFK